MKKKTDWDKRYNDNDMPWDTGMAEIALINLISQWPNSIKRVLEIGCGTGTNAVWLAKQGLEVTAIDISDRALALAEQRCTQHKVQCRLLKADFLTCTPAGQFDLLFDRGCFHCTAGEEAQKKAFPMIQLDAWLKYDAGQAKISPEEIGIPRPE